VTIVTDSAPKTAYELAMERLRQKDKEGGVVEHPLTDEQKKAIAEARRVYEAKVAEREILHRDALRQAKSHEEVQKLNEELAMDRDRFARDRDRKIGEIRDRS
jgi:primosomal protein N''